MKIAAKLAHDVLKLGKIRNLSSLVTRHDVDGERVVAFVWGIFAFRGVLDSLRREAEAKFTQARHILRHYSTRRS